MMDMEELQKACETLAEAWNKALEPMEKFAKALSEAFGRMYGSEEKTRKIRTGRKHKSVKRVPDSKMSTYQLYACREAQFALSETKFLTNFS